MKMLQEFIKALIIESRGRLFDWYSTQISRIMIQNIHNMLATYGSSFGVYKNTLANRAPELANEMKKKFGVTVNYSIIPMIEEKYKAYNDSGAFAVFDTGARELKIALFIHEDDIDDKLHKVRNLQRLIPIIKETIRHELEHSTHRRISKDEAPIENMHSGQEIARLRQYFEMPEEIAGFAVGFYKHSKASGKSVNDIIDEYMSDNIHRAIIDAGGNDDYAKRLMSRFKFRVLNYLKRRYPQAKL